MQEMMSIEAGTVPVSFIATNVTGTQSVPVEIDGRVTARSVADSIVDRMALPDDVTWALRDDDSSTYLDDGQPIGPQIGPGSRLTITPKTHLGAGRATRIAEAAHG